MDKKGRESQMESESGWVDRSLLTLMGSVAFTKEHTLLLVWSLKRALGPLNSQKLRIGSTLDGLMIC